MLLQGSTELFTVYRCPEVGQIEREPCSSRTLYGNLYKYGHKTEGRANYSTAYAVDTVVVLQMSKENIYAGPGQQFCQQGCTRGVQVIESYYSTHAMLLV
jgi:hypothetical protein